MFKALKLNNLSYVFVVEISSFPNFFSTHFFNTCMLCTFIKLLAVSSHIIIHIVCIILCLFYNIMFFYFFCDFYVLFIHSTHTYI